MDNTIAPDMLHQYDEHELEQHKELENELRECGLIDMLRRCKLANDFTEILQQIKLMDAGIVKSYLINRLVTKHNITNIHEVLSRL